MTRNRPLSPFATILALAVICFSVPFSSASANPPVAEVDLICSPSDPTDCFPKIFVPTDVFQPIREGQEVPPGLHMRLNVNTGEKEAKILNPSEDQDVSLEGVLASQEGIPVDNSIVIIPGEEAHDEELEPHPPAGAPAYDPIGNIKEPEGVGSVDDETTFQTSLTTIRNLFLAGSFDHTNPHPDNLTDILDNLEELAHDMYYGLKLTEDKEVITNLFCLMSTTVAFFDSEAPEPYEFMRQAAAVVAAATQNNPKALEQISRRWPSELSLKRCPRYGFSLRALLWEGNSGIVAPRFSRTTRAKIAALNGLVKDAGIKNEFLESGGMRHLLNVVATKGRGEEGQDDKEWERTKVKVAHFVADNFLDESMGAELGLWPLPEVQKSIVEMEEEGNQQVIEALCGGKDKVAMVQDKCWGFHLRKEALRHMNDESHWSRELYGKLTGKELPLEEGHSEL